MTKHHFATDNFNQSGNSSAYSRSNTYGGYGAGSSSGTRNNNYSSASGPQAPPRNLTNHEDDEIKRAIELSK